MFTNETTRNGCIQLTAPTDASSGNSHWCHVISASTPLMNSDSDLRWDTWPMSAVLDESSGVAIQRNCVPRLGSGANGSIVSELGSGGKLSIGCFFLLCLLISSLLHPSLRLWISAGYKWCHHGFYHLRISVNGGWSFAVRRNRRKVTLSSTDWLWDLLGRTIAYIG